MLGFSKKELAMGYVGMTGIGLSILVVDRFLFMSRSRAILENMILVPAAMFAIGLIYVAYLFGRESAKKHAAEALTPDEEISAAPDPATLVDPERPEAGGRGASMSLALKVQERYWHPARFDPSQPDTAPKQREIVEWIKEQQPGISDVLARSIEKVACPIDRG
jgi:hypothetical protein